MVLGKGGIQKHDEKVILLPTGASQEAAGKSPSIQPEDDREDPGAHGLDAETNATCPTPPPQWLSFPFAMQPSKTSNATSGSSRTRYSPNVPSRD